MSDYGSGTKNDSTPSKTPKSPLPADVATIRAAIMDVLDAGPMKPPHRGAWIFQQDESELEDQHRMAFVDLIIARIAQLQQPPFVEQAQKEK